MKIESTIRQINAPQQAVYNMLSNLDNINKVKDRIPQDKVERFEFTADTLSISTQMGSVELKVVEREEPKLVKLQTTQSPLPFTFWIQMLPVTDQTSKMKLTVDVDVNPIMGGMVKKPLKESIEKIADAFQMIPYE
jgi:carbon monoxide dehydrogenase subunit G